MKRMLAVLAAVLCAVASTNAQNDAANAKPTADATASAAKSQELAEAARLNAQAVKLYGEGKYDDALEPARRALEIRERAMPEDHTELAVALINLAAIHLKKNRSDEAEKLYNRALAIYEKKPSNMQKAAAILDTLGFQSYSRGDFDKAGKYFQRAVEVREQSSGTEHASLAPALVNLAEFHQLRMNDEKAEPIYQRALAIMDKTHDPLRPEVRQAAFGYACLLHRKGRKDEAREVELRYWRTAGETAIDPDEVFDGKSLSKPPPRYPAEAKPRGVQGAVAVRVLIDGTGGVVRACAVSGPSLLRPGSEQAAYAARFSPTLLRGKPAWVTGVITYRYVVTR